jgi:hypothetical protein
MGCGVKWQQIGELDRALGVLRRAGLGPGAEIYNQLYSLRGRVFAQVGFKYPRTVSLLLKLIGLSPGTIKLWHDVESGWLAEARRTPSAPPVYKYVSDDIAAKILKKELTHELEEFLMTPDTYAGE